MRKVKFIWQESWSESQTEIFEFEDDTTDDEIQSEYDIWIGELIGDRMNWSDIEE